MTDAALKVGQLIQLDDGRTGTIRFLGSTHFKDGEWIGVELEDATGKNDGSVQGERYFDCDMGKGLFCQAQKVGSVLKEPEPTTSKVKGPGKTAVPSTTAGKAAPGKTAVAPSASRTSTMGPPTSTATKRNSLMSNGLGRPGLASRDPAAARRQTLNEASPTPQPRTGSALNGAKASPSKAPTRPSALGSSRGAASPTSTRKPPTKPATTATPSRTNISTAGVKPTPSSSTAVSRTTRPSLAGTSSASRPSALGSRPSPKPTSKPTTTSGAASNHTASASRTTNGSITQNRRKPSQESNAQSTDEVSPRSNEDGHEGSLDGVVEEHGPVENDDGAGTATRTEDDADSEKMEDEVVKAEERPTPRAPLGKGPTKTSAPASASSRAATAISNKREEELQMKLQTLEKRHADDRERLSTLEKIKAERDRFENVIQTLQNKYRPLSQKLADTEKKLKETEEKLAGIEMTQAEHDSAMEMAALDREVAEETAESLREQYEELKYKVEELELELETTRHENEELATDLSPEERASKGWMSMENENARLKAALIRLRDMTKEKEADLNKQVAELQEDLQKFDGLQAQYDETKQRLEQTEADILELKDQLEAARGSEDMMEELTEKNLAMTEQIGDLQLEIEQLEDLRDLNDEMELAHVENEKQMQDELDHRDSLLAEHNRLAEQQASKVAEYDYTVSKFRELVAGLQTHIADMKASQQLTEAESEELTGRSKAIMDLNMKLQESATKTQIRTVDLELGKLEAEEAVEHLDIVMLFLPEAYHSEKDSVLTYLRFKRIGFKARLLYNSFKERFSTANQHLTADNAFISCEIMDKLCWISTICSRFVTDIKGCSLERFAKYGPALQELNPVERSIDSFVDAWKTNEVKEANMSEQLQRSKLLLDHLAETHIENSLENYADEVLMRTTMIQAHLENTSQAFSFIKTMIDEAATPSTDESDETESDTVINFKQALDKFISQSRSGRVIISKAITALGELNQRSMTLSMDTKETFESSQDAAADISAIAQKLGDYLRSGFDGQDSNESALEDTIRFSFSRLQSSETLNSQDRNPLVSFSAKLSSVLSTITALQNLATDLTRAVEFQRLPPPWIARSNALTNTSLVTQSTTEENARLKDSIQERTSQLRVRDERIEEQTVKIELLESRMRDANVKAAKITELQNQVESGRKREKELTDAIESQLRNASSLQAERDRWKAIADETQAKINTRRSTDKGISEESEEAIEQRATTRNREPTAASAHELDALRHEIKDLQGAVRHLRSDNQRVLFSSPGTSTHMSWLSSPLVPEVLSKEKRDEREKLTSETVDVFADLIALANRADVVDLTKLPKNKLAWRPAKEKSAWIVAAKREEWEGWCRRRDATIKRGTQTLGPRIVRRPEKTYAKPPTTPSTTHAANGNISNSTKRSSQLRPRTPETDATSAISSMPPSPTSTSKQPVPGQSYSQQSHRSNSHSSSQPSSSSPDVPTSARTQQQRITLPANSSSSTTKPSHTNNEPASPVLSSRSISPEEERAPQIPGSQRGYSPENSTREPTSPLSPTSSSSPNSSRKRRPTTKKRLSIGYMLPMKNDGESGEGSGGGGAAA